MGRFLNVIKPKHFLGLRHIALRVDDLVVMQHFYIDILGFKLDWQPDEDNVYLTSGMDNIALHKEEKDHSGQKQSLDHMGFLLATANAVDEWYHYMAQRNVANLRAVNTHRDGSKSFYCEDPEGNQIQFMFHPRIGAC